MTSFNLSFLPITRSSIKVGILNLSCQKNGLYVPSIYMFAVGTLVHLSCPRIIRIRKTHLFTQHELYHYSRLRFTQHEFIQKNKFCMLKFVQYKIHIARLLYQYEFRDKDSSPYLYLLTLETQTLHEIIINALKIVRMYILHICMCIAMHCVVSIIIFAYLVFLFQNTTAKILSIHYLIFSLNNLFLVIDRRSKIN